MPLLAEHIPEHHGIGARLIACHTQFGGALGQFGIIGARHAQARQVALDIRQKNRNAEVREALRQHLQGDGLAGAGGAGNETVAVGILAFQIAGRFTPADQNMWCGHCLMLELGKVLDN